MTIRTDLQAVLATSAPEGEPSLLRDMLGAHRTARRSRK